MFRKNKNVTVVVTDYIVPVIDLLCEEKIYTLQDGFIYENSVIKFDRVMNLGKLKEINLVIDTGFSFIRYNKVLVLPEILSLFYEDNENYYVDYDTEGKLNLTLYPRKISFDLYMKTYKLFKEDFNIDKDFISIEYKKEIFDEAVRIKKDLDKKWEEYEQEKYNKRRYELIDSLFQSEWQEKFQEEKKMREVK